MLLGKKFFTIEDDKYDVFQRNFERIIPFLFFLFQFHKTVCEIIKMKYLSSARWNHSQKISYNDL